jgi:hypothetical protein
MKPRRLAQISTFAIDKSPTQYCLACTVNVKREFIFFCRLKINHKTDVYECVFIPVPDPGKGVCADPVNRGAILEGRGPGPPRREQRASVEFR